MRLVLPVILLISCAPDIDAPPQILLDPPAIDLGGVYPANAGSGTLDLVDLSRSGPAVQLMSVAVEGSDWIEVSTENAVPGSILGPVSLGLELRVPADAPVGPYTAQLTASGEGRGEAFSVGSVVTFDVLPCDGDGDGDGVPECGGGDCDDADPARSSLAAEICNGVDDDCNGVIDDAIDADGDGVAICVDCDDADPLVFPGAPERCNGVDDDCDGRLGARELDGDGDGVSTCDGDCNDLDDAVFPGALELCNGIDDDCDGLTDDREDEDGDSFTLCEDCDDADARTYPGAPEQCDGIDNDCDGELPETEADRDGDGVSLCARDCDDADADVFPGNRESCNGEDDDCDEVIDEDRACPCTRVEEDGDVYLFCNSPRPWTNALGQCASWNYHLLTIDDADEDTFALDEARDIDNSTRWWMGFNDRRREGVWEWEDGSPVRFTNWQADEPNDQGGEDCGQLNFFSDGTWNDQACTLRYPFVCELD